MHLLNQAHAKTTQDDAVPIILDIDLFREWDPLIDDDGAWGYLERLRTKKNEVFETCITDRRREVIN